MMRIKMFLCICFFGLSSISLTDYSSDKIKSDANYVAESVDEMKDSRTTNLEEDIFKLTFELGYAKYLKKYNDNGNGGYRKDFNHHLYKLTLKYNDENYICWFRVSGGSDDEAMMFKYRTEIENTEFETKQMLEEYLDLLLRDDVINFYTCTDESYQMSTDDVYTESYILE